ncbi:MAG: S41 family peptidase [Verrucomicrobiota bacterium]|nr:S41 family peptidase [Verrucomicrobiota bacterium]
MTRPALLLLLAAGHLFGQTPAPEAPPAAQNNSAIINAMGQQDLHQAIQLLKSNYLNPEALNETELSRATLSGLLSRLGRAVMLLPEGAAEAATTNAPFFSEVLEEHISYLRLGALSAPNLQALDAAISGFAAKKIDAVLLDLRASGSTNDFTLAAEIANRFCPKGKPLFTLRKAAGRQERSFTSDRDPAYQGLMIVLVDGDTSGPAEAVAGVLRLYNKALLIGQPTAGRAVEYSDLPLNNGRMLRVAGAEAVLPENRALFPAGLKPDLSVEMPPADKRLIIQQSVERGMSAFVFESERPHLNEAALLSGRNPEMEANDAARRNRNTDKSLPRDPVVQRAVDIVTSLSIYQQR